MIKEHGYRNGKFVGKMIKKGEHLSKKTEFTKGFTPWNKGKGKRFKLICEECKKTFEVVPNRKDKAKYCSIKCARVKTTGAGNNFWKGGKIKISTGYIKVLCKDHPYADSLGYVMEHRLVMEKHMGRYLSPKEVVHHIDHNVSNNSLDNLAYFPSNASHSKFHYEQRKHDKEWGFIKRQTHRAAL